MFVSLDRNRINWCLDRGLQAASDAIYVSNLIHEDLRAIEGCLREILGDCFFVGLLDFTNEVHFKHTLTHQRFDEAFQLHASEKNIQLKGTYLRVFVAYSSLEHSRFTNQAITDSVNFLRFRFGCGAALERVVCFNWDLSKNRYPGTVMKFMSLRQVMDVQTTRSTKTAHRPDSSL